MRLFFIVTAGVLFADFVESGWRHWDRVSKRMIEKEFGVTEEQYTERYMKEHPKSKAPLLPIFWLVVVVLGFLWAVFWR